MSAPGFFMAAVAMMQIRQVGVLGEVDTNSIRVDTLQTRPLADGFPRVNLAHKHKPLQRVLASPYRAELLAAKGYYIDENQVIRKHSKSNLVPLATPGSDSTISLPTEAPRTHKTTTCRAGVALTLDLPTIARQQVSATGLTNMASIIPTGIASTVDDPTIAPEQNSATELDDMASGPTGLTSVSRLLNLLIPSVNERGDASCA
jgi:hypothetical protein